MARRSRSSCPWSSTWIRSDSCMISAHVVLDDEQAEPSRVPDPREGAHERVGLLLVEPGRRLVEEQETRPQRERASDAELALLAVGQCSRRQPGSLPRAAGRPGAAATSARASRRDAPLATAATSTFSNTVRPAKSRAP